jgi:hypothetical protein
MPPCAAIEYAPQALRAAVRKGGGKQGRDSDRNHAGCAPSNTELKPAAVRTARWRWMALPNSRRGARSCATWRRCACADAAAKSSSGKRSVMGASMRSASSSDELESVTTSPPGPASLRRRAPRCNFSMEAWISAWSSVTARDAAMIAVGLVRVRTSRRRFSVSRNAPVARVELIHGEYNVLIRAAPVCCVLSYDWVSSALSTEH